MQERASLVQVQNMHVSSKGIYRVSRRLNNAKGNLLRQREKIGYMPTLNRNNIYARHDDYRLNDEKKCVLVFMIWYMYMQFQTELPASPRSYGNKIRPTVSHTGLVYGYIGSSQNSFWYCRRSCQCRRCCFNLRDALRNTSSHTLPR